jgi:hypothetical protein
VPADMNETLRDAAARPSRDVPLVTIERRLRSRRRQRLGAAATCGVLVAGLMVGAGVLLTDGGGPSVRTTHVAQSVATGGGVSVSLPDGWVDIPLNGAPTPLVLAVGTAELAPGTQAADCVTGPEHATDAFVRVSIRGEDSSIPNDRPDDFATAPHSGGDWGCVPSTSTSPTTWSASSPGGHGFGFRFAEGGRLLEARVVLGTNATANRLAEAFAVLNSLVVTPITNVTLQTLLPPTVPTTGEPPSTVPTSADTKAITAAFETWIASKPPAFAGADAVIEDWASIKETAKKAGYLVGNPQCYTGHVDAITRVGEKDADVIFSFLCDGQPATPTHAQGRAVKINGVWMVSRDTVCETFAIGEARCPPRK